MSASEGVSNQDKKVESGQLNTKAQPLFCCGGIAKPSGRRRYGGPWSWTEGLPRLRITAAYDEGELECSSVAVPLI